MKPFSKSVWMTPAHFGAFQPLRNVHARASFGPAVRKLARPSVSYASLIVRSSDDSASP